LFAFVVVVFVEPTFVLERASESETAAKRW
jgi:hypothetical protein